MKIWSDGFKDGERIPEKYAFGKYHPEQHMALSDNKNPHLAWSEVPDGTRSIVLICHDPDVPSKADDVNQEGKVVPEDLPRVDFYHWVLVDLDPNGSPIAEGEFSDGVTLKGKKVAEGPRGTRQGVNNYTQFLAGNEDMAGTYYGYDGPCPPWNDEIIHHYEFTLYATDLDRCPVEGEFSGGDVLEAIEGHVLDKARIGGTYAINPDAK